MRRDGYYFVKRHGEEWEIAYWSTMFDKDGRWSAQGECSPIYDHEFEAIDEHLVTREGLEMFDEMLSALRETRNAMQIAGGEHTCKRLDAIITRARALQEASK